MQPGISALVPVPMRTVLKKQAGAMPDLRYRVRLFSMSGWRRPSVRACVRSDFSMLLTTQFSGQGARCGTDRDEIIVLTKAIIIVILYQIAHRANFYFYFVHQQHDNLRDCIGQRQYEVYKQ